ncbi:ribonuclease H [Paenibacillus sp. L3-i20]|uniref:ribonuclease H n=1 Tax=Paenibacillus sp. L3-i20 TaxID=2905833 RepID=UPI001EDCAF16|nr:ribonuclease H family protein [Paenibacillus sp. L3-i20]GKU78041.1 ribonuclease H [Paenibacillus sp. L3-i20]
MAKSKYYVVWVGRKPGVYTVWSECQEQVNKFEGAKFKSYESKEEAESAYRSGWQTQWGQGGSKSQSEKQSMTSSKKKSADVKGIVRQKADSLLSASTDEIDYDSISVDVGTSGNPGPTEYKGVDTQTGDVLFTFGPVMGTNNLGEFLAIVHALMYLQKLGSSKTVYSDSMTAMKWVRQKKVASTLVRNESTKAIWLATDRAVEWLQTNNYKSNIVKWKTDEWGEIKADYGRK